MSEFANAFALVLAQIAPFLLLGLVAAALLHAYVPGEWLARALGGSGVRPILLAALIGAPLPLCSCSVIPVAVALRRRGAGRGATAAFLISAPETGVDSIVTSIAVLHPMLVVARPLAALLTGMVAGLLVERFTSEPPGPAAGGDEHRHASGDEHAHGEAELAPAPAGLRAGLRYALVDLFGEIAVYLVPAFAITALLTTLLDPQDVARLFVSSWAQMVVLLVASLPVYVCASAATPIAAALVAGGFAPGAALVFLLAGPATNLATITAAGHLLGRHGAVIYVLTIIGCSLLFGAVLDQLFQTLAVAPHDAAHVHPEHVAWWHWAASAVVVALLLFHAGRWLRGGEPR